LICTDKSLIYFKLVSATFGIWGEKPLLPPLATRLAVTHFCFGKSVVSLNGEKPCE